MKDIYCPDIECDSCVKLISKKLRDNRITDFSVGHDKISIDDERKAGKVIDIVKGLGYRASTSPFERKTFKERWNHFKENRHLYDAESTGIKYSGAVFLVLSALAFVSYFGFLKNIPGFLSNYGWWIFYLIITITTMGFAAWHFYTYRAKYTCMVGMMVGMTFGMQTGMMLGAIIGATNGFFIGSMAGMLIGVIFGAITGNCCGIMGIMEGMMAGVMGGTMGPMISVMMFSDNLLLFMPFYMVINILIVFGLSYMLYEEVVENNEEVKRKTIDFVTLLSASVIVMFLLSALMIYGPKSALLSF